MQQQQNLSRNQAIKYIENEDQHRTHWTRYLYKMNLNDPRLYDIVVNIGQLKIQDACELICTAAQSSTYTMTSETKKALGDLAVASRVKAVLQEICDAEVISNRGNVHIKAAPQELRKPASPARHCRCISVRPFKRI